MLTFVIVISRVDEKQRVAGSRSDTRNIHHSSVQAALKRIADLEIIVEKSLVGVGEHDRHNRRGRREGGGRGRVGLPGEVVPTTSNPVVSWTWEGHVVRCDGGGGGRRGVESESHRSERDEEAEDREAGALHDREARIWREV